MKPLPYLILAICLLYSCNNRRISNNSSDFKTYGPTWESLESHPIPQWLIDAKFGIYAHWGVYSVPAYETEWYGRKMYEMGSKVYEHHVKTYGDPSDFGYKDFIPMFKAENYDPEKWAAIIKASGAKYAGFAVVHHDGFSLWNSKFNRWNSVNMGPHRDLYGDFVKALRKNDLHVIATFHHSRTFDWYLPYKPDYSKPVNNELKKQYKGKNWDIFDPQYGDLYWSEDAGKKFDDFLNEWKNTVNEVVDDYQPDVIWFDGGAFQDSSTVDIVRQTLAYYLNKEKEWNKPVEVLNKLAGTKRFNFPKPFGILTFEEGRDREINETLPWIDDMKISDKAWCYVEGQVYKDANEIIDGLIDRVSRGGGLLLNLSPRADGTIPEEQENILIDIGNWLKVNGEAIYGTKPWNIHAEGPQDKFIAVSGPQKWSFKDNCDAGDIRFTVKDNTLYVIALGWPENMELYIKSINSKRNISKKGIANVSLVGSSGKVNWTIEKDGTRIILPEKLNDIAVVLKFEIAGKLY